MSVLVPDDQLDLLRAAPEPNPTPAPRPQLGQSFDQPDAMPAAAGWQPQTGMNAPAPQPFDYFNRQQVTSAPTGAWGDNAPAAGGFETLGRIGSGIAGFLGGDVPEALRPDSGATFPQQMAGSREVIEGAIMNANLPRGARSTYGMAADLEGAIAPARLPQSEFGRTAASDALFTLGPNGERVGPTGNVSEMRLGREPARFEDQNRGLRSTNYGRAEQANLAAEEQAAFRDAGDRAMAGAEAPIGGGSGASDAEFARLTAQADAEKAATGAVSAETHDALMNLLGERIGATPAAEQGAAREAFYRDPANLGDGIPLTPEQQANVSGTVQRAGQLNTITDSLANARAGEPNIIDRVSARYENSAEGALPEPTRTVPDADRLAQIRANAQRIARGEQPIGGGAQPPSGNVPMAPSGQAAVTNAPGQPGSGIAAALGKAKATVSADPQGVISRVAGRIPGLRTVRDWDRPGLAMQRNLLEGHIARSGVEGQLLTGQSTVRYDALREIEAALGEGAASGKPVLADRRIPGEHTVTVNGQVFEYPASGTAYDRLQRPYAYSTGPDVERVAAQWGAADEELRTVLNDQYGGDVGKFVPERGGVYVANVNVSKGRTETLENIARQEGSTITSTGKSKPRVFESGFERWANDMKRAGEGTLSRDQVFVPETDLRVLGYTADLAKAHAAGDLTFRSAAGGKTISEVKEMLAPKLVAQRDAIRTAASSLAGRIMRAEQSMGRDTAIASRLESQAEQTARRAETVAGQAERRFREPQRVIVDEPAAQFPTQPTESDAIIAQLVDQPQSVQFERMDAVATELDRRVAALDRAARGPATRADLAGQAIPGLRDDLASLKDEYARVKKMYDGMSTQDYVQPSSMPGMYFPSKEAATIDGLAQRASQDVVSRTLEGWRSQVLAGDIGPLTGIQGLLAAASGRAHTTRAVIGSIADGLKGTVKGHPGEFLRPYTADAMEQFIRENSALVQEYAFYTGRSVGGRLPAEIGESGILAKIPGFVNANEGMFNVSTRRQIEMFRGIRDDLVKAGYSAEEAAAGAADLSNKVIPLSLPARLGQSSRKGQIQRYLPTSIGFIRQPFALTEEAFTAMTKLATGQKITPHQKLAVSIYGQLIGNVMAVSLASAGINALARKEDPVAALMDAVDTNSRAFMAVSIGNQTVPLASQFRAPLRLGIGMLRNVLNLGTSRAGVDISQKAGASPINYGTGRIGPQVRTIGDTYQELTGPSFQRQYKGDSDVLRLLSAASIAVSGAFPLPAQGVGKEAYKQYKAGEFDPVRLGQLATAELGSFNLIPKETPSGGNPFSGGAQGNPFSTSGGKNPFK